MAEGYSGGAGIRRRDQKKLPLEFQEDGYKAWKQANLVSIGDEIWFIPLNSMAHIYSPHLSKFICAGHERFGITGRKVIHCNNLEAYPNDPCGFYATREKWGKGFFARSEVIQRNSCIKLEVELFGKVVEYEECVRGTYQRVLAVELGRCNQCLEPATVLSYGRDLPIQLMNPGVGEVVRRLDKTATSWTLVRLLFPQCMTCHKAYIEEVDKGNYWSHVHLDPVPHDPIRAADMSSALGVDVRSYYYEECPDIRTLERK